MKHQTLLSLLAVTGFVACSATSHDSKANPPVKKYVITTVTLVDVEKGIAVPGQTVIVVDDRIEKIGAHGKVDIQKGAVIINGHGLYLMPGLVDAHVHYLDAPIFGRLMLANAIGEYLARVGKSRGSYLVPDAAEDPPHPLLGKRWACSVAGDGDFVSSHVLEVRLDGRGGILKTWVPVRHLPRPAAGSSPSGPTFAMTGLFPTT